MDDTSLPTYLTRGLSLTNAELCTKLGAELLSLCQSVTADGRMAPEELDALKRWLGDAESASMPASRHLRGVIEKVLADGKITADEYQQVYRAVESVLPFAARREAMAVRLIVDAADEEAARAAGGAVAPGTLVRIAGVLLLLVLLGAMAAWFRA